jgi:hypothetical protein
MGDLAKYLYNKHKSMNKIILTLLLGTFILQTPKIDDREHVISSVDLNLLPVVTFLK